MSIIPDLSRVSLLLPINNKQHFVEEDGRSAEQWEPLRGKNRAVSAPSINFTLPSCHFQKKTPPNFRSSGLKSEVQHSSPSYWKAGQHPVADGRLAHLDAQARAVLPGRARPALAAGPAQAPQQLLAQLASGMCVQRVVDRLVRHASARVNNRTAWSRDTYPFVFSA